ncbi:hypothetical protein CQ018_14085 [Arthrobacter sp. MYb227]|nr:hypothetical protein CQ018_14085 [Arthrobacter sp. MYb227]
MTTGNEIPELGISDKTMLRAPDGGSEYLEKFHFRLPSGESFFPIGVWLESIVDPADLEKDSDVGLNTYVDLTTNSNLELLSGTDSLVLASWPVPGQVGAVLADEVDMWAGPGESVWTGNWPGQGEACSPSNAKCGYSVQSQLSQSVPSGTMRYANYGKGVTFWESDEEAGRFVNDFQDIVSADNYWFTDPDICGESQGGTLLENPRPLTESECRHPSNYGWTVERLRGLVKPAGSLPVWSFIEVGHPFTESDAPTINGSQIRSAVWSSIIHGARGIIYFNHNFSGDCPSQHVLRECGDDLRDAVRKVNSELTALSSVLNAPFLDTAVNVVGSVDASVKVYENDLYILAGVSTGNDTESQISSRCMPDGYVEVLFEERRIPVINGSFKDEFADSNTVHIYKSAGNSCML